MSNLHLTHYLKNKNKGKENAMKNCQVRCVAHTDNPRIPDVMTKSSCVSSRPDSSRVRPTAQKKCFQSL